VQLDDMSAVGRVVSETAAAAGPGLVPPAWGGDRDWKALGDDAAPAAQPCGGAATALMAAGLPGSAS
jgi:hypothetical protein